MYAASMKWWYLSALLWAMAFDLARAQDWASGLPSANAIANSALASARTVPTSTPAAVPSSTSTTLISVASDLSPSTSLYSAWGWFVGLTCPGNWDICAVQHNLTSANGATCADLTGVQMVEAAYVAERFNAKDIQRTEMRDESVMGKSTCCLMLGSNCRQITRHIASGVVLGNGDVVRSANSSAPLQASRCYKYMVKTLQNNAASCPNNNIVCLGRNMNEASQCTTYAAFIAERNG